MKFVVDLIRNTAIVWFCLTVVWFLAELQDPGQQFADPVLPCLIVAWGLAVVYTALREVAKQ